MAELRDTVTTPERRHDLLTSGAWDSITLWDAFCQHADRQPDAVAIIDQDGALSHTRGQLKADALTFATDAEARGLRAGDVIAVQLPNRYEAAVVGLAAFRLGLILNPLLPNYRVKELDHIFRAAAPRMIVSPDMYRGHDHAAMIDALRSDLIDDGSLVSDTAHVVFDVAGRRLASVRQQALHHVELGGVPPAADSVSELIFSSGTESTPKGIMHTEQTTNAGVRAFHEFLRLDERDVVWMPSPVGHSTGFNFGLRFALYHGLPLVLQDRWDPALAADLCQRFRCTYTLAATTFLQDLVDELNRRGERLDHLSRFCCGGAPVPPELVAAADERGIGVLRLYGSTEALVVTCSRPDDPVELRMYCDGVPLPGVSIRARADDGSLCGVGVPGEIEVQSWQRAVGYFADPERTASTFSDDGWVRSGDLGVIDGNGALSIVGRKKEIIIRGGLNIAPREIEELLLAFDEVERCAVIGLPDQRLGERVCACVCLRPGSELQFDDMVERLRAAGLATYKLPQRLEVVATLPATASGKVQKHVLREQFA